ALTGGLGFGGPCFPRDNAALGCAAAALGVPPDLLLATDRVNRSLPDRILAHVRARIAPGSTVAILGLAYKPSSHAIDASQTMMIANALVDCGTRVLAYDPLAGEAASRKLGGRERLLNTARDCVRDADVVLIGTPDPEFAALRAHDFRRDGPRVIVIDFWRILSDRLSHADGIEYVPYGHASAALPAHALRALWDDLPAPYES